MCPQAQGAARRIGTGGPAVVISFRRGAGTAIPGARRGKEGLVRARSLPVVTLVSVSVLASAAFAQTAPPATLTPVPSPPTGSTTVRVVPPSPDLAQELSEAMPLDPGMVVQTHPAPPGESKETKGEFVVAPIPISDPAVGSGLGVTTVYTFPKKKSEHPSPPPILGGGAFYTSNGSWGGAAVAKLFLKEDRYRVTLGATIGSFNYDLFAAGSEREPFAITQDLKGALGQVLVGLAKRWYAGVRVSYLATEVSRQHPREEPIPIPHDQLDSTLVGLGVRVERDSRDSIFYPTAGSRLQLWANHNDTGLGSDFTFTKSWLIYTKYIKLIDPLVLAVEGAGCYATEGGPFYSLCMFGSKNLLRGYTVGQFLDRWTLATQAEGRWRFAKRWIGTAFVGVGEDKPALPVSADTDSLPAAGIGLHWIAAPENMITVRAEYAVGEAGLHGFYVAIGQAF